MEIALSICALVTTLRSVHCACSVYPCFDESFGWSPESSIILSAMGWNTPLISFNFTQFTQVSIDENAGLESLVHFGGDIEEDEGYRSRVKVKQRLWPRGRVPYFISSSLMSQKNLILSAMRYIESKTCIRYAPRRNERDYIILFKGDGCHSSVGMFGGGQTVSLGQGCYKLGKVVHELLHILGFYHEQSRPDRDRYIQIHWENVKPGHEKNFEKMSPGDSLILNAYDYNSVMHYGEYSFSRDRSRGLKTMTAKTRGVVLKGPEDKLLSPSDIRRIKMLYRC